MRTNLRTVIPAYDTNGIAHVLTCCCPPSSLQKLAVALVDTQSSLVRVRSMVRSAPLRLASIFSGSPNFTSFEF